MLPADTFVVECDSVKATATTQNIDAIISLVLVMKGLGSTGVGIFRNANVLRVHLLNDSEQQPAFLSGDYRFCRTVEGLDCTEKRVMSELRSVGRAHGAREAVASQDPAWSAVARFAGVRDSVAQ